MTGAPWGLGRVNAGLRSSGRAFGRRDVGGAVKRRRPMQRGRTPVRMHGDRPTIVEPSRRGTQRCSDHGGFGW